MKASFVLGVVARKGGVGKSLRPRDSRF